MAVKMFLQPYSPDELHFAYCYRVYLRWRTHRARPYSQLGRLDKTSLSALVSEYDIHVLECAADATDLLTEVSLKPTETVSACASKVKGRVSKWLRNELELEQPSDLLSRGYFACTIGKSKREEVEQYLDLQGTHHGSCCGSRAACRLARRRCGRPNELCATSYAARVSSCRH